MQIVMRILLSLFVIAFVLCGQAKTIYDSPEEDIQKLFKEVRAKYILRYNHTFADTLKVPVGCELAFDGGYLTGPIVFNGTKLSGKVNLRGSSLSGSIRNKIFEADWLCDMDGETDDARCINDMISVCDMVHFPKGQYRLRSKFDTSGVVDKTLYSQVQTHIGINKSNVKLIGDEGAEFITNMPLGSIFLFSKPNQIENSIHDIEISGITFTVYNDGREFHEYMHTIKMMGVNGITIKNCKFNDFWGDAICLGHYGDTPQTGERTRNQNVCIINNTINGGYHHNNRNGISVISGKNVLIKGNDINNTSRNDMPGGVDVEPNNSAYTIDNIRIENNIFQNIKGGGGAVCIVSPKGGYAHKIYIVGNKISSSNSAFFISVKSENTTDTYVIKNNFVANDTKPFRFEGSGYSSKWTIVGNNFEYPFIQGIPGDITVSRLVVKNNKKKE